MGLPHPYDRECVVCRRSYQRYRERLKQEKEEDQRTIKALEADRAELARRVEVLQKVISATYTCVKMFGAVDLRLGRYSKGTGTKQPIKLACRRL